MSNIKWALMAHPANSKLKIAVSYAALNKRSSHVMFIAPLYDLRDTDLSGDVGYGEAIWHGLFGSALKGFNEADLMSRVAMKYWDPSLQKMSTMKALKSAFTLADEQFRASLLSTVLGKPLSAYLKTTNISLTAHYILRKTATKAMRKALKRLGI